MKLTVVMPVYNEEETIAGILQRVVDAPLAGLESEIIVVDDGSSDQTAARARAFIATCRAPRRTLRIEALPLNRGKGYALRQGFALATGDIVVIQDADLEYDPRDIDGLVRPILDDQADVVFGSRFLGGPHRVLYYWHSVGNHFLTMLSNMFTNLNLTDMETCYKAFRAASLRKLTLTENRFGIEVELTAKVARARLRVYEVPISYHGRTYAEGKKITWHDGAAAIWHILRHNI